MNELDTLRAQLDALDAELTALFLKRMDISSEIGAYKAARGLPVLDSVREDAVLASRAALAPGHEDEAAALFRTVMSLSRRRQRLLVEDRPAPAFPPARVPPGDPRVLYQGIRGAYAGEAAACFFAGQCEPRPAPRWEDIFLALQAGEADYGVLPIENSSTGGIAQVYDLLARYNCYIVGEQILRVRHCLMGLPGAALDGVREVCSHEQGLLQCQGFLKTRPGWRQTVRPNTAESAAYVAERGDAAVAAICSRAAGELYGLVPLAERVSDSDENYTRFVVVSPAPELRPGSNKLSALVTLPHRSGSLYELIQIFAAYGLNLLKLESRPIPARSWEYLFFVDFEGSLASSGMAGVLSDLAEAAADFRLLGNYPEGGT